MNVIVQLARTYAPWIMLPASATIGFIGYKLEWWLRTDDQAKDRVSVQQQRDERQFHQAINEDYTDVESVTKQDKKPRDIFDKNQPTDEQRRFI